MLRRAHLALLQVYKRLPRRWRLAIVHALAPSYTVGAICIVERADGRLLLVRHSYRNAWGFPGGLLSRGEEAPDGAVREAREECDITVEVIGEPAVVVAPDARRVDVVFRCRTDEPGNARAVSPEVVEVGWFARDNLPDLQHEAAGALVALARAGRHAS
ncbi:MAG TPA: NUDIX domain-containing protein [Acidimicrobiales bacterium]|nr:NUDIX domain-containing protein [Acidimicrobiales bacterium]